MFQGAAENSPVTKQLRFWQPHLEPLKQLIWQNNPYINSNVQT